MKEQTYRQLSLDSSSSLKLFADSPYRYYTEFLLGQAPGEEESRSSRIGSIVHTLLLEGEEAVEEKFYMSRCEKKPTDKMMDFVQALFRHTKLNCTEQGEITASMDYLIGEAYRESGFKWKLDTVVAKFKEGEAQLYYKELREAFGQHQTIITLEDRSLAERVADYARQDSFSGPLLALESDGDYTVYNELKIEGYTLCGLELKSMLDKVVVNHQEHTIQGLDLKVVWSVSGFYTDYYLHRKAYIQAYLYTRALVCLQEELGINYRILPFQFLVIDSTCQYAPVIYQVGEKDLLDAYRGFLERGWWYVGVEEVISNLLWAKEQGVWNLSREAFEMGRILPLKKLRA